MQYRFRESRSSDDVWWIEERCLLGLYWRPLAVRTELDRACDFLKEYNKSTNPIT